MAEDVGIAFPGYGLIATDKTVQTRKLALKGLVSVQKRAWDYIRDGHIDEAADAIMKQRPDVKLDRAVLREQVKQSIDFFHAPPKQKPMAGRQKRIGARH